MNQVCICKKDGLLKKSEKARYYKESSLLFYIKNNHKRKEDRCQEMEMGNLYRRKYEKRSKLSELSKLQKI